VAGLKKWVPMVWSNSSMIAPPARMGIASSTRIAVMNRAQMLKGKRNQVMPGARILMTVVM